MHSSKKVIIALSGVLILLTGCGSSISSMQPLTLQEVAGQRVAQTSSNQTKALIQKYISEGITVNPNNLLQINNSDMSAINNLLSAVSANLRGANNSAIGSGYANYLLLEFARTPYEWQQTSVTPVGFDPATRLYFVDVTYSTTNTLKSVVPSSKIPNGSPNEAQLKQARYNDYITYLSAYTKGDYTNASNYLSQFTQAWGSVQNVMQEQQGTSLLSRTHGQNQNSGGLGKLTYSGLVNDSQFNSGATMTFRYVFRYNYNLGDQTNLTVSSLYLKSYQLSNSDALTNNFSQSGTTGTEVLQPFVDRLINSYNKAMEEGNDQGLYSLFFSYGDVDKYYEDLDNYAYDTVGGYSFKILQRVGTNVYVEVTRINQVRAKGAEMSMPTYNETLIFDLVLDNNDQIRIRSVNLLNSQLIGEPLSIIKNVTGVSDQIEYSNASFTASNKAAVESTLREFSKAVFEGKLDSSDFQNSIDIGISDVNLKKIANYVTAIPKATSKYEYIEYWNTTTNVFSSVTIREIFDLSDGSSLDTEAVVDLANRNGNWKVVNYTRTLSVQESQPQNLNTKDALCVNTK